MQTFLKPPSASEEKEYLTASRNGNQNAKNALIERNLRLVAHIAKKYVGSGQEQEDLISIGTIGLIKAVDTFDPEKGSRLGTYAARCIENEILMVLRAEKKRSREVSLYDPIGTDKEGNEIHLLDIIIAEESEVSEQIILQADLAKMYQMLRSLPERERRVLCLRYGLYGLREYTQREVAALSGISRSYVSRIEKSGIEHLREAMEQP
ncbi:MAG: RNA polymerase sporulation sigma factor SigK [Cuneatibacter sp.]|nr:RNA polymerase sporulation sigma factor SigK [Cuneatibacter sp.]